VTTTTYRTIDIETTGLDPAVNEICEIGWRDGVVEGSNLTLGPWYEATFVQINGAMPLEATAVHHIMAGDLDIAPTRSHAVNRVAGADLYVAHNAAFEQSFLPELAEADWLCTYRCALRLFDDAPGYSVQMLRYYLGVALSRDERETLMPHRAGPDAYVTAFILKALLRAAPMTELARLSSLPPLLKSFRFGKHKDEPIADVPMSYFDFIRTEGTFDEEVRHTVAVEIARRAGGDHELYFDLAAQALEMAGDRASLDDWWKAEADNRAKHQVVKATPLYDRLVDLCKRKAATFPCVAAGALREAA